MEYPQPQQNPQEQPKKYWFFGSKLNTGLLLVLIILMVIAIRIMLQNKETYLPITTPGPNGSGETLQYGEDKDVQIKETYTYTNHGFSIELPKGFIPKSYDGETGPTISIELPNKSYLVYITNAEWWFKNNIEGQATYLRDEKSGLTLFKVYKYNGQDFELYIFRQGNVAYSFGEDSLEYMKTFKFIGWPEVQRYSKDGVSFSYPKDVTLNSFVASSGYTVIEFKKKDFEGSVSMTYAKRFTNEARAMAGCFEMQTTKITIGSNIFTKCSSNAEPSDTYLLSGKSMMVNVITSLDNMTPKEDFIDLSSIKLN